MSLKVMHLVTDFCKVNVVTKSDSYPIPRIEDCIEHIGVSKYVSKLGLLKGNWQVPLTDRVKEMLHWRVSFSTK